MVKKVNFGARRPSEPSANADIDQWVEDREAGLPEPTKRLTIDVPISLHKRIKSQCALQNLVMAEEIRDLLEKRFPKTEHGQGASVMNTANREYDSTTTRHTKPLISPD